MLVPVEWLKEYAAFDVSPKVLADRLTMAGLEVEEIHETEHGRVYSTYVTPNRPDLLSIVGVAREVSALLNSTLTLPPDKVEEGGEDAAGSVKVDIETPENCFRYSARVIKDVKVCDSPKWMQERLIAAGLRPINNVVDATNYVLFELGQPLHAFDCDLVKDHHIIVRLAGPGEKITTIDGEERTLDAKTMVIADSGRAVAIAGVMGGLDTEVSGSTKHVLLESASFNRISIRRTARVQGMNTEASYRFERGVDPNLTMLAIDRAAELIRETGGGTVLKGVVDVYPGKAEPLTVGIRPERASAILGFDVTAAQVRDYLTRLGMDVDNNLRVKVPTFRPDITREIDLIEEVGRIYGYEKFPETLPLGRVSQGHDSEAGAFAARISDVLVSAGLQEVVTSTMGPSSGEEGEVRLKNPLSDDLACLRKGLVLDLLRIISYNTNRGRRDASLFQIGRVFDKDSKSLVREKLGIAGALTGSMWERSWNVSGSSLEADFFLCKGIVNDLLERMNIPEVVYKPAGISGMHPTRAAFIEAGGRRIGVVGQIGSETASGMDVPKKTFVFELDFEVLMGLAGRGGSYRFLSRYPSVVRDLAVVVDEKVPFGEVEEVLREGAGVLLESASLFDLYSGEQLPGGRKSLAFNLSFRSDERTLRDEEVDDRLSVIRTLLSKRLGASFRD